MSGSSFWEKKRNREKWSKLWHFQYRIYCWCVRWPHRWSYPHGSGPSGKRTSASMTCQLCKTQCTNGCSWASKCSACLRSTILNCQRYTTAPLKIIHLSPTINISNDAVQPDSDRHDNHLRFCDDLPFWQPKLRSCPGSCLVTGARWGLYTETPNNVNQYICI